MCCFYFFSIFDQFRLTSPRSSFSSASSLPSIGYTRDMIIEADENSSISYAKSDDPSDIHPHHEQTPHEHQNDLNEHHHEKTKQDIFNKTFESYQDDKSFSDFSKPSWDCLRCCMGSKDKNVPSYYSEKKSKYTRLSFYRNNLSFFVLILVYIIVNASLVGIQLHLYKDFNSALKTARVGGILLNFNCSLIILLVLRRLLTWLRNSVIGTSFLPLDDFIKFHKFIGMFIFVLTILHTIGHLINLCTFVKI